MSCVYSAITEDGRFPSRIETLNDLLIEDAADLVADYIQEQKEEEE